MKKVCTRILLVAAVLATAFSMRLGGTSSAAAPASQVTFYRDVLPILQSNCQSCHRPGEVAPMSLLTYEQSRPYAKAIKEKVLARKMPPWFADPRYGHFANARTLSPQEINTLVAWVDGGALAGDKKDAPPPKEFVDGWNIGKPDVVLEMPQPFHVPAQGTIDYQWVVIPTGFTKDMWVEAAEIRPGNRAVVHHVLAFVRPKGSPWMKDAQPGVPFSMGPQGEARGPRPGGAGPEMGEQLKGYAPGIQPLILTNTARLIPAGSDIVLQLHYTTNGTPADDQSKMGLVFAKDPPAQRQITLMAPNPRFAIPPNDPDYEVTSVVELEDAVTLTSLVPHMHFRGKDFMFKVVYPSGESKTLLSVPHYDFNWQLEYDLAEPLVLPKGTRIECTAHYDNSANNPFNPDPNKLVRWGEQTWDEMMIGYFTVTIDRNASAAGLVKFLPGETKSSLTPRPSVTEPSSGVAPKSGTAGSGAAQ
jgi:mono/diheme cytochrome c family protein